MAQPLPLFVAVSPLSKMGMEEDRMTSKRPQLYNGLLSENLERVWGEGQGSVRLTVVNSK